MKKSRILITGASRGIGRAIALALVNNSFEVVGTSRNASDSPIVSGSADAAFPLLKLDLSDKKSIEECARQAGDIDALINNAGISQMGAAEELPVEKVRELFETNLFGLIELTQRFLPAMRKKRKGFIINIGSLAGKFAVPYKSSYVASKFALAGFSWSLRNEVMPFGIKVTVIEPADIHTSIEPELYANADSEYAVNLGKVQNARNASMDKAPGPEMVAEKVGWILRKYMDGNAQPDPFYAVGKNATLLVGVKRFTPDRLVETMVKKSYGL